MKNVIIVPAMCLCTTISFAQNKPIDTANKNTAATTVASPKDTATSQVVPGTVKTASATNSTQNAEKKENVDSTTLLKDLAYQQQHSDMLYKHKAKVKTISLIASLLLVVVLGFYLLFKTGLCRDLSYNPATNQLRELKERPFSFSKIQMFWWTLIILSCFTFFYFYTGFLLALNPTIILLLGGVLTVAMFGKMVDNTQMEENNKPVPIRHQDLEASKGLLIDILSDEGGISIHRFQSLIFNFVFGLGFITSFCSLVKLEMYPFIEFEPWQLTLLGISAAGYLGFKNYENSKATKTERQVEAVTKNAVPSRDGINKNETAEIPPDTPGEPGKYESAAFKSLKQSLKSQGLIE